MRGLAACLAACALAACGSEAPSPLERQQMEADARAAAGQQASEPVVLTSDGLVVEDVPVPFSSERELVERAMSAAVGSAPMRGELAECGAGPLESSRYANGLTLYFQQGFFAGWFADAHENAPGTAMAFRPGVEAEKIEGIPGFERLADSTLGDEFMYGDRIGGFIEDGRVTALYAGTNCFFR